MLSTKEMFELGRQNYDRLKESDGVDLDCTLNPNISDDRRKFLSRILAARNLIAQTMRRGFPQNAIMSNFQMSEFITNAPGVFVKKLNFNGMNVDIENVDEFESHVVVYDESCEDMHGYYTFKVNIVG